MFNLNEYMKNNNSGGEYPLVKRIMCNDGFNFSAQASKFAYCSPRMNHEEGIVYNSVEVGFPSEKPDLIMEYCETPSEPTETVYGYVPVKIVEQLVELHGGFKCVHEL